MITENNDSLNSTPRSERLHIGFFGRRNAGKSSLINAVSGHETALVSNVAGTTTDPVYKSIELHGLGACVLIDTAGFDDEGALGELRVKKTMEAAQKTDVAVIVVSADTADDLLQEKHWIEKLREKKTPILVVLNKCDAFDNAIVEIAAKNTENELGIKPLLLSANDKKTQEKVRLALLRIVPEDFGSQSITGRLVKPGDTVLLVMPQDIQAPKGRLILPQVQTIRDLLDNKTVVVSATADNFEAAIDKMKNPPELIITDSQIFSKVFEKKPETSRLTSFSVLLAGVKGDLPTLIEGAKVIDRLNGNSKVLIAEACTHVPLAEDIGRVKIPRMLRKRFGESMKIDIVSGVDFPANLKGYDLVVHCGGCMFNRKYLMNRIEAAKEAGTAFTNYGVLIAGLNGILDKIVY